MAKRLHHHFEPEKGWINDPNGLVFFRGENHAFFQHNPYEPKWGPMHWGHAVSRDLIHWNELPIALSPDQPYENSGGCFSGGALVKDNVLYVFYTAVSEELGQTQCLAMSRDGVHFEKYPGNPIIKSYPSDGSEDFRDPHVFEYGGAYFMVIGSGKNGVGKILLYRSEDLTNWDYRGVLFEGAKYGGVLECPDFFALDGKFVLMFSQMGRKTHSTAFITGQFDGERFLPEAEFYPEAGPHFYAPQTFHDETGRRILIAWLYSWDKTPDETVPYAGALTIPREVFFCPGNGALCTYPVKEAWPLFAKSDEHVEISENCVKIKTKKNEPPLRFSGHVKQVDILADTKTIEVFINGGESSFSYWF